MNHPPYRFLTYFLTLVVIVLAVTLFFLNRELRDLRSRTVEEKPVEIPPTEAPPKVGVIALIIDDFGYRNDEVSDGFINLDADLTFAIIPGHRYSRLFAEKAASAGKEVIVHMPMESRTPTHGEEEFVLLTSMTSAEIERRVESAFSQLPQTVGMNNHQGSRATEDKRVMHVVASTLKREGKYFVDSRTTRNTVAEETMRVVGVPVARRNVFLDNEFDSALINEQLDQLISIVRKRGMAIGIGHAKPTTLQVLKDRIPELKKAGFRFEFVSAVVN